MDEPLRDYFLLERIFEQRQGLMTKASNTPRPFMPGLQLSQFFYEEAVQPLLATHFPTVIYSAGLLGAGSEVLGFDTAQSTDHDWGPRLLLFLADADHKRYQLEIDQMLRRELPHQIHGYPTNFATTGDAAVNHRVHILTVQDFLGELLSFNPTREPLVADWLIFPEQILRSVTSGRVFHDGLGELARIRAMLHYYPHDIWLYLLACQWRRIAQEEAFMGRCGQVGDELGSRLVGARLVRDLMRLCFLMERQYAPYMKWFGTAFAQLRCAAELGPILQQTLAASDWQTREGHLTAAYERVAQMHNALGITAPLPTQVSSYYDRPFFVLHSDTFAEAIRAAIADEEVRALPTHIGSIDQFVDSTDVLSTPMRFNQLKVVYE